MDKTMILTPAVARALEDRRRQLDSDLSPFDLAVELQSQFGLVIDQGNEDVARAFVRALGEIKERVRELGALDQVCAQHGITEFIATERSEEP